MEQVSWRRPDPRGGGAATREPGRGVIGPRADVLGQARYQVAGQTQSGAEPSTTKLNATAGWLSGSGGCGVWPQMTSTSTVNEKLALLFDEATYSTVTQRPGAMGNGTGGTRNAMTRSLICIEVTVPPYM